MPCQRERDSRLHPNEGEESNMQFPRDDCNPNKAHLYISPYQKLMCSNRRYNSKRKKGQGSDGGHSHIIQHFGGNHDTGDEQAVDIERSNKQVRLAMDKPVYKHISHHKARRATTGVLEDTL
jgi:hypothetical protein